MKGDRRADYLAHMIDAARVAMSYAEDMEKPQFLSDRRTQQAVLLKSSSSARRQRNLHKQRPTW
jgi:uncharacterized protein with HEPN domain